MKTLPPISCCQSFILVFKNCCKFSGRSRRSEFFYYYMPINIIILALHLSATIIFLQDFLDDSVIEKKMINYLKN